MRYEDASGTDSFNVNEAAQSSTLSAHNDADVILAGNYGPVSGNAITGAGTISGLTGADMVGAGASITAIQGAGGTDTSFSDGKLQIAGQYGVLSIDAQGNYSYVRNHGTPNGVSDVFSYTLSGNDGAKDVATLTINIGKTPLAIQANAVQVVPGPDGVVTLPAGVELSDIHVVGRNLVIDMPDGSQMIIIDGAVFVPQLVLGTVEVPSTNLAALLIDSEPTPAAGPPQSSGGNFAVPVPPLDPGAPLGDLIPPTVLTYTPPEFHDVFDRINEEPEAGTISVQLDDDDIPGKGGNPGGVGDDAGSPNAIASGFLPGSGGDEPLTWALLETGAPGGFTYDLQADGSVKVIQTQDGNPVVVLTITVNADTGAFVVTENNPVRHATGDNENNADFVISFTVTDDNGDFATGSLNVNVDDDTPTVTVTAGPDADVILTTHDAATIGAASESVSTSANFSGVFTGTTVSPGADGAGSGTTSGYALSTTGVSGLTQGGVAINLYNVGGVIIGSTAGTSGGINAANTVFSVSVSGTGVVTLTQFSQIDHTNTDPSPTGAPFTDQFISLTDGSITLTRSETVVDKDGDSVTGSASVGIGANLHFVDDGPTISLADRGEPQLTVDETDLTANATASFAANFSAAFGADGPAASGSITYALGISAPGANSGLIDVASGSAIVLVLNGAVVEGHVGNAAGALAFTVSVNAAGDVTLDQIRALTHPNAANPDDSVTLSADNLVTLTATAHDFDGDTASSTINIGQDLHFEDDGPNVSNLQAGPGVTLDETTAVTPAGFPISASSAGPVVTGTTTYGADGAGTTAYGLSVVGGGATLLKTAIGDFAITLVQSDAQTITGQYNDGSVHTAFTVHINADGTITVTENVPLEHNVDGSTPTAYNDALDLSGLINASITVTDRDGDTATGSLGIGNLITFLDDGPSIDVTAGSDANVLLQTQDAETIGGASDTAASSANFSGVFGLTAAGGADGAAGTPVVDTYALGVSSSGVDSGLNQAGANIYLYVITGKVVGSTSATIGGVDAGNTVFDVAVSGTGVVTLTQYSQIDHPIADDPTATGTPFADQIISMADSLVTLTGSSTITDNDGDTATDSATVNIGANLQFADDGPDISAALVSEKTIRIDETDGVSASGGEVDPVGGNLGTVTVARAAYLTVTDVHVSADAPTTNSYALQLGTPGANGLVNSGLLLSTTDAPIYLYNVGGTVVGSTALTAPASASDASVVFTVSINASGDVTLTQILAVEHTNTASVDEDSTGLAAGALNVVVTATDFDGDTDNASVDLGSIIRFEDDGPSIDVTTNPDVGILVTTHDALTIAANTDSASASFAGAFGLTSNGGSDGAATTPALSYVLGVPGAGPAGVDSGLDQGGANIYLYKIGNLVVGSTSSTQIGVNAGNTVFDVGVVASGVNAGTVTLTQYSQIDHPLQAGLNDAPFADQLISMTDTLVTLTASSSITDNDGDTVSDSALINIGANLQFADHGPTATNDVDNIAAGFFGLATGNVMTGVEVAVPEDSNASDGNPDNVGADAPGRISQVSFTSDLGGAPVVQTITAGGSTVIAGDYGVLTLYSNGDYSYDRNDGSAGGVDDVFTYTLRDFDGDTVTATLTINIGVNPPVATTAAATVDDDGLLGSPAGVFEAGKADIDANVGDANAGQPGDTEAIFKGALGVTGGDGDVDFNLIATGAGVVIGQETVSITGTGSLLTATITASPDASRIGTPLFTVSLDQETGNYTVTLLDNVLHGDDANDNEDGIEVQVAIHYQVTDVSNNHSAADGILTISFNDDTPVNNAVTYAIGTVHEDALNTVGVAVGNSEGGQSTTAQILGASLATLVNPGADTPLVIGLNTLALGQPGSIEGTATGLTQLGVPITWHVVSATQIDGVIGGNVIFSITDNPGDANFTFTLKDNIDNNPTAAGDADTDALALTSVFTATDADGDKVIIDAGASIAIQNDVPVNNGASYNAGTVHEDALNTVGVAVGNSEGGQTTTASILGASLAGLVSPGADAPVSISLNGLAVGQPGSIEGTATGLTQLGVPITWHVVSATQIDGVIGGNVIFSITDNPGDANFTFTLKDNIDNNPTAAGDADTDSLNLAGVFTATDTDGDKVIIDAGATVLIQNDVPTVTLSGAGEPNLQVDESNFGGNAGPTSFAGQFIYNFGADGQAAANPFQYNLGINAGSTGLVDTITGAAIVLSVESGAVVGRAGVGGPISFTITVDASGNVSLDQSRAIVHPNTADPNDSRTFAADNLITLSATIKDGDGDTATVSAPLNIAQNFSFLDDGPSLTVSATDPVTSKTATGDFTLNVGADQFGPATLLDTVMNLSAVSGTVGGNAITNFVINPAPTVNTATTVTYAFSFTYDNDPLAAGVQAVNNGGTVTFNTTTGEYSVTLTDSVGFTSTVQTNQALSRVGYNAEEPANDVSSGDEITVSQLTPTFFVQFSGQHNAFAYSGGPNGSFSGSPSYVSISGDSNGVASDTIAQDDVLNMNFFTADPGGDATPEQTRATADAVFVQIDHFGSDEDLVVVLKLIDPANPGTIITRTIVADHTDFYYQGSPLGITPAGYNFTFDQDDAVLIIEANDYRFASDPVPYVIVGMQIVTSTQGTTGSGYNLNGVVGASGGVVDATPADPPPTVAFSALTDDNDVTKIVNIGFKLTTATPQPVTLNFNASAVDNDGDGTGNQALSVTFPASVMPVVLDMDGDGVEFVDHTAGVAYDYNGDGVAEATGWVGAHDAILVRDANGNGTVDNASEFVFGHDGLTDLQALAAQYGSALDANDTDFGKFAVWQDANSNGVADAGEVTSLTDAGINSISLSSDGIAYTAAGGDVEVAGTGSYTRADGSTGLLADAAFLTEAQRSISAANNNTALIAALAAAGVAAAPAAAQSADPASATVAAIAAAVAASSGPSIAGDDDASRSALGGETREAASDEPNQASSHSSSAGAEPSGGHSLTAANDSHPAAAPTELLQATDAPSSANADSIVAPAVSMPSAQALIAAGLDGGDSEGSHSNAVVGQVLVDALEGGGGGQSVDALLAALPAHGLGGNAAADALASQPVGAVPAWDTGHSGGFTAAANFTMEAVALHHDAVQAVANG